MSMYGFWADFFTVLQVLIGVFLIFIIMLQRGKGGGLVGALGGMGGASAFGPKADVQVLKLTIGLAVAWVFLACVGIFFNRWYAPATYGPTGKPAAAAEAEAKAKTDPGKGQSEAAPDADAKSGATEKPVPGAKTDAQEATKTPAAAVKPAKVEPAADKKDAAPDKADAPAAKTDQPSEKPTAEKKPAAEKAEK